MERLVIKQAEVVGPVWMDSRDLNVTEIFASHQNDARKSEIRKRNQEARGRDRGSTC